MSEERIFNYTDQDIMRYFAPRYAAMTTGRLREEYNSHRYAMRQFHDGTFGRKDEHGNQTQEGVDMKRHERLVYKMAEGLLVSRGALKPRKHRKTFDRTFRKKMRKARKDNA